MTFSVSVEELFQFARKFWQNVPDAKVFAFHGVMGAGKTTIIAALCREKGSHDVITSPTFSIINEYAFDEDGRPKKIYHMDLFRLTGSEEVVQAGVEDCLYSGEICMVEWPEKAPELLDNETVHVWIEPVTEKLRRVTIETTAAFGQENEITS